MIRTAGFTMNGIDKDRLFAAGMCVAAVWLGYESFGYPAESSFFPRTLSIVLGLLALLLLIRLTLKKWISARNENGAAKGSFISWENEWLTLKSAGLVFGSIIAYGLLMTVVNYETASVIFLAAMITILGLKKPLLAGGLSVGLMLLLYGIFFRLLGVSRPESLFFQG